MKSNNLAIEISLVHQVKINEGKLSYTSSAKGLCTSAANTSKSGNDNMRLC
jgi:hypothetical protein